MDINNILKLAWEKRRQGDYESVEKMLDAALQNCPSDDHFSLGRIYHIYRQIETDRKHFQAALALSKKSLEHYQKSGDPLRIAHSERHLADVYVELGEYQTAAIHYEHALKLYDEHPQTPTGDLANAQRAWAVCLEALGKNATAIKAWQKAGDLYGSIDLEAGVLEAKERLKVLGST